MPPLLLASASPRRRALLAEARIEFEAVSMDVVELDALSAPNLSPARLAEANARLKAHAAARSGQWILGADTVVVRGVRILGKPATLEQAHDFLRILSGGAHEVITGCALLGPGEEILFHEITRVVFRELSEETIARYLAEVAVLDKAGAYALQEKGEMLVESVDGSRVNVIGLPIERLLPLLRERGLA